MKFLLSLMTFFVAINVSAEVMTLRTCTNITRTVTVLQQDISGACRIVVQRGDSEPMANTACEIREDSHFLDYECRATEHSAYSKLRINKVTQGATLTTKSFFAKNYELNCQENTL